MRYIACSVRDRAADVFAQPMFVPALGQALRGFSDEINRAPRQDQMNPLYSHPEDFDMYELGSFDDNTGKFESLAQPRMIAVGKDVKVRE